MNIKLLWRARKQIQAEPEKFSICNWFKQDDCGTIACIGGWMCLLEHGMNWRPNAPRRELNAGWYEETFQLLNPATYKEFDELVILDRWPQDMRAKYYEDLGKNSASVTVERIDKWVKQYGTKKEIMTWEKWRSKEKVKVNS